MLGREVKSKKKTRRGGLLVGPRKNQQKAEADEGVRQRGGAKRGREEPKGGSSSSVALVGGHKDVGTTGRDGVVEQGVEDEESSEW